MNTESRRSTTRSGPSSRSHDQSTTARNVCCRGNTVRAPAVNNRKRSSKRSAICRNDSIRNRAAANSTANGNPSSRRHTSSAAARSSPTTNPGRAAAPRSPNNRNAT
ncbi:hypothetical protein, partial [Streptomyces bikiniensis]|uniref:hypothetical protein n=1 Tax=Streptomyces bikiniensis TaxID=1896 RepID=UPI00131A5321